MLIYSLTYLLKQCINSGRNLYMLDTLRQVPVVQILCCYGKRKLKERKQKEEGLEGH